MTQLSGRRPLEKRYFGNELRLQPVEFAIGIGFWRTDERRALAAQGCKAIFEFPCLAEREARRDVPDVTQLSALPSVAALRRENPPMTNSCRLLHLSLIQRSDLPERYGAPTCLPTIPSRPRAHAEATMASGSFGKRHFVATYEQS